MTQYWLCIANRENWKIVQQHKTWGVAERHRNTIARVKPGDHLLFYLVGETLFGQKRESAIGGEAEAASQVFHDTRKIFSSTSLRQKEVFPLRINLSHVRSFEEEIPFKPLLFDLTFIKNKRKWSGHIQGRAMRMVPEEDFETIVRAARD
ncbi:MAG: EVE domain-containing protein [Theionarchaea archaeon]|nr:EVE domain-containing protein [Theionarchaea archaeon]